METKRYEQNMTKTRAVDLLHSQVFWDAELCPVSRLGFLAVDDQGSVFFSKWDLAPNKFPNEDCIHCWFSNWATHEVPPWKIVWMLFFNKGLIRHPIIWETLHFKALTQIWLSKVKGPALPKERWRKGFVFIFHSKKLVLTIEYHPDNYIIQ